MPAAEKKARADMVIVNEGSLTNLAEKVDRVLATWGIQG
jgi:dephospho-CoA kinase